VLSWRLPRAVSKPELARYTCLREPRRTQVESCGEREMVTWVQRINRALEESGLNGAAIKAWYRTPRGGGRGGLTPEAMMRKGDSRGVYVIALVDCALRSFERAHNRAMTTDELVDATKDAIGIAERAEKDGEVRDDPKGRERGIRSPRRRPRG
jgi:hypothetical protein